MTADEADALGLGLPYGTVRLAEAESSWPDVAARLIDEIRGALGPGALGVAHIGSTTVVGMLAKPIIDIAIRASPVVPRETLVAQLESLGYDYRGDGGSDGGLVFVFEVRPLYRVAHLHVVVDGDPQWDRYLSVVERLRRDPQARAAYEAVKRELAATHAGDRRAYTTGKSEVIDRIVPVR